MASIPKLYSDYPLFNQPSQFANPDHLLMDGGESFSIIPANNNLWGDHQENYPVILDNDIIQPEVTSSPVTFPERLGISNLVVPAPEYYNMGLYGINVENYGQLGNYLCEFGEDSSCCSFSSPEFKPLCPTAGDNWGILGNQTPPAEESNIKVGRYSVEERKDRILRYLKKRNQRNFNKTIKYACRKTLADRRVRIRGRFARNNEQCEEDIMTSRKNENLHMNHKEEHQLLFPDDALQIKHDEEWLQEAMSNLIYLPYMAG
ncbi:two-component response regulator-like PRR37 [Carica papaya]|uniref:two-component response regulator-like PRR37 n=1 Tax=Carica papaya TaxID=3649 RepID=UPI000B8D1894|nr:two-component response regulator-like PRR37 [Carica papaya]